MARSRGQRGHPGPLRRLPQLGREPRLDGDHLGLRRADRLRRKHRSSATSPTSVRRSTGVDVVDAFIPAVAPGASYWIRNEHYATEEEFVYAFADALREEYRADRRRRVPRCRSTTRCCGTSTRRSGCRRHRSRTTAAGRSCASRRSTTRCEGIPEDRVRYHICSGSDHGRPHARRGAARHHRPRAEGQRALLPDRAGQRAPRARMADLGGRRRCRRTRSSCRASSPTRRRWSNTRSSSRSASCGSPSSSAASA